MDISTFATFLENTIYYTGLLSVTLYLGFKLVSLTTDKYNSFNSKGEE